MYAHELHRVYISFKQIYDFFLAGCAVAVLFRAPCRFNFHFIFVSAFFLFVSLQSLDRVQCLLVRLLHLFLRRSVISSPASSIVLSLPFWLVLGCLIHFQLKKTSYLVVDIFKCLFLLLLFHCVDFHFVRTVFFSFVVVCNSQALDEFIFSVFHNLKIPYASFTYFIRVYNALHVHLKHISSAYQRFLALPPFVLLLPSLALFFSSFFVAALSISFKSRLKVMRE